MIILGIDPGTATTGYGVIRKRKNRLETLDYGCILTSPSSPPSERLKKINNDLNLLIKKHKPNILAVEKLYFFKNLKTAMPVSQAKGVILLTAAKKKDSCPRIHSLGSKDGSVRLRQSRKKTSSKTNPNHPQVRRKPRRQKQKKRRRNRCFGSGPLLRCQNRRKG